jgi:hypothetical protein
LFISSGTFSPGVEQRRSLSKALKKLKRGNLAGQKQGCGEWMQPNGAIGLQVTRAGLVGSILLG